MTKENSSFRTAIKETKGSLLHGQIGAISVMILLSGCAYTGGFEQPDQPPTLKESVSNSSAAGTFTTYYSLSEYQSDLSTYNTYVAKAAEAPAKAIRNKMMGSILADIDYNYGQYKGTVHLGRASGVTVTDAMSLGLSAAGTVAGGPALKSILAAADTALKGTMQSYDKNFYAEKTTEILVAAMDTLHQTKETQIIKNMTLSTTDYPFALAKVDLIELFYTGTREAALCELEKEAGKNASDAQTAKDAAAAAKTATTTPAVTTTQSTTVQTSTSNSVKTQ